MKNIRNNYDQLFRDLTIFRNRGEIAISALWKITHNNCLKSKKIAREALKDIEKIIY